VGWEGGGDGKELIDAYRVWEVKASRELRMRLRSLYFSVASAVERACDAKKQLEALSQWLQSHPRALIHGSLSFPKRRSRGRGPGPSSRHGDTAMGRLPGAARGAMRRRGAEAKPRRTT